jgi:protein-disulfide isomerase
VLVKKKPVRKQSNTQFIGALVFIAIAGVGALGYVLTRPKAGPITVDPAIPAGAAVGHLLGIPNAPVQVMEFGDFECPHCAEFANVTEPDVRARLVNTGIVAFRFYDYPLAEFRNSWTAHLAASCAEEQGKFWEMHDKLYGGQDEWNAAATSDPLKVMRGYARDVGLDAGKWESCVTTQKPAGAIKGNQAEGIRRKITGTPTIVIGDQMVGGVPYDQFKQLVDQAMPKSGRR